MDAPRRRISLRLKITSVVGALLALIVLFLSIFIPVRMNSAARLWSERQAQGIALVLASAARVPYDLADLQGPEELQKLLALLADAPGATYGAIRRDNGTVLTTWNPNSVKVPQLSKELRHEVTVIERDGMLNVLAPIETKSDTLGMLQIGFSTESQQKERRGNVILIALTMIAVFGAGLLALSLMLGRLVINPVARLTQVTTAIVSSGDLTQPIDVQANDEIGELSDSFRQMVGRQRTLLSALRRLADALGDVIHQISSSGQAVANGAATIQSRVEEASQLMQDMLSTIQGTQNSVEVLHESAEHGSATIHEMATVNEQAVRNTEAMARFVSETTNAIDGMAFSIREIAGSIEQVNAAVGDTSTSMTQMETTLAAVERNSGKTADLSKRVADNADLGVEALQKTLDGVEMIRQSFDATSTTIDQLIRRILEVGKILHVIDEITEQTNLLALNAAIISAQAGEHGRGFSVVAEEIRALADRTKTSTKEITELIRNVQGDSQQAIQAMERGMESVQQGVQLGREASRALQGIQVSAREATQMVQQIARATVEQASGNKVITAAVNRIADTVGQINRASTEQARGSELIIQSTGKMNQINTQVYASSQEQATGSRKVIESIERINEMVRQVGEGQKGQIFNADKVLLAVRAIEDVSGKQNTSVRHLEEVIESLQQQANDLRAELGRFRT